MNITTKNQIENLTDGARKLLHEIEEDGELANRSNFENRTGWEELVEKNMVNCWDDDAGNQYCEPGKQQ